MKSKLLALFFLAGSSLFAGHWSVGIGFGGYGYYPPPVVTYAPPPPPVYYAPPVVAPAPGYVWIDGYYYPSYGRYAWRPGYWSRPPYAGAYWVRPRYYGGRYYGGHWGRRW